MMDAYREMLTYIKSAVTRNYSEKCINSIMDFVSGSAGQNTGLLQEFYQTTLTALEEAKNEVSTSFWLFLWFNGKVDMWCDGFFFFWFCRDSGSRRILSSVTFGLTLVSTDGWLRYNQTFLIVAGYALVTVVLIVFARFWRNCISLVKRKMGRMIRRKEVSCLRFMRLRFRFTLKLRTTRSLRFI